ncbi:helix-turn-helix domain-containing protein [Lactococcus lactis]|uniref:helix-turn-helix domain-containing protein n=1 Tax=Lactococcus lactis TaxID=1358 RepID=UPI0025A2C71A|nr:helix-turn-helix transcriptional regulator [Lactococcus lactis]MDM7657876.1 helix-turn-helix transcriptional regulator [Lactococcus lactis]
MEHEYLFVYSRLKLLIKDAHKSFNQVEWELGSPRNTLENYKYKKKPSVGRVFEMANYFNVSIEFLLGIEEKDNKNSLAYRLEKLNREKKELEILILEGQK